MKKFCIIALLVVATTMLWAQNVKPEKLDLSQAEAYPAGPDRIYVSNINYGGSTVAVILEYDGRNGAKIIGTYFGNDILLPSSLDLGYVKFGKTGPDTLTIDNVIIGNSAYKGTVNSTVRRP